MVAVEVIYGWIGGGIFGAVAWNEKGQAWKPRWLWVAVFFSTWVWPLDVLLVIWGAALAWRERKVSRQREARRDEVMEKNGFTKITEDQKKRSKDTKERLEGFEGVENVETIEEARDRILREAEEIDRAKKKGVH